MEDETTEMACMAVVRTGSNTDPWEGIIQGKYLKYRGKPLLSTQDGSILEYE